MNDIILSHKEVNEMKIKITGDAKEIAALILAVQERQFERIEEIDEQLGLMVSRQISGDSTS